MDITVWKSPLEKNWFAPYRCMQQTYRFISFAENQHQINHLIRPIIVTILISQSVWKCIWKCRARHDCKSGKLSTDFTSKQSLILFSGGICGGNSKKLLAYMWIGFSSLRFNVWNFKIDRECSTKRYRDIYRHASKLPFTSKRRTTAPSCYPASPSWSTKEFVWLIQFKKGDD